MPGQAAGTVNQDLPFDHVVVVMMENHSFDNLLGALSLTRPDVDGLTFRNGAATNTNPGVSGLPPKVSAFPLPDTSQGSDVSQTWQAAHAQINGGAMDGFVASTRSRQPMGYYTSETLPFAYDLASRFTVGNRWFCSLPGPTYPNRRFLMAGTADGCTVTNSDTLLERPPPNGTIFDSLSNHGVSWCNYFNDVPMTMVIPSTIIDHPEHHLPVAEFFAHCQAGTLPAVSFVDPRIGVLSRIGQPIAAISRPSAGLPPLLRALLSRVKADLENFDPAQTEEDPQDMYHGELWAHGIVQAVLDSPCWPRTLLIYIYDEHGGYYDHVPPPAAVVPDDVSPQVVPADPTASYNLYGPRVPAIVVSPYSKFGQVTNVVHDHTSVLATIEAKWNLPALTRRDANANTVLDFLDFDQEPDLEPGPLQAPSPTGQSGPVNPQTGTALRPILADKSPQLQPTGANMQTASSSSLTAATDQKLTFWIAFVGIVAVLIAFGAALLAFHSAKNPGQVIPAVLGVATAAIGTLAGLVAGHAVGSAGKAQSDQRANTNERDAANGRALAQTLVSDATSSLGSLGQFGVRLASSVTEPLSDEADLARRHAELAKSLFPEAG